jgi:transglutaminase-like putative cysteine protease
LRILSARVPALALLEAAAVSAVVVWVFAGHRDAQVDRPRFLSDWAFSRGDDPLVVLFVVGMAAAGGVTILLLQRQRPVKTLATLALLLLLGGLGCWLFAGDATAHRPPQDPGGSRRPSPQGGQQGEGTEQDFTPGRRKDVGRPKAVVIFHDDYTPPERVYYFREVAFSQFNGRRLVRATAAGGDADVPREFPARREAVPENGGQLLPALSVATTVVLIDEHARPPALVNATELEPRDNPNPKVFRLAYGVKSRVLEVSPQVLRFARAGNPAWGEALRNHYLAGPEDPRYRKLADEIAAGLKPADRGQPLMRALATRRWIEKNVVYSRSPTPAGTQDPTTAFLFGDRRGYCVHIAHAMAYLLRAQGIPARVGAGYAVEAARRGEGSSLLVQSTDAHAWCEIYLEGDGWVVVDAAPERSEEPPPPAASPDLQRQLAEQARRQQARPEDTAEAAASGGMDWRWLLLVPAGLLACLYLVKGWRRLAPRLARAGQQYRVCYRAVLDALADLGLSRQFGETREEFAARVAWLAPEFVDLSAAHVRQPVAGLETYSRGEWLALKDRVVQALAEKFAAWRRLLGALNPVSWLWAH